ncbi:hypothetical protein DPMN_170528 [Dreissena polymorpha]|uniref:Uncharacterized protein n=1 Tax=Dreissena polymorpha TaxID=45954 RepID=A0A9D4IEN8_DREPO|nr:hypothetical protein DPMN_170528 [Dreissena polymorpha]
MLMTKITSRGSLSLSVASSKQFKLREASCLFFTYAGSLESLSVLVLSTEGAENRNWSDYAVSQGKGRWRPGQVRTRQFVN